MSQMSPLRRKVLTAMASSTVRWIRIFLGPAIIAVALVSGGWLADVLGLPDSAQDERFATNSARVRNRPALIALLEEALAVGDAAQWQERLTAAGVPAGKVGTIDEGIALAESLGLEPTIDVVRPDGSIAARQVRHPITWQPAFDVARQAPPQLGQHTDSVKAWLASS